MWKKKYELGNQFSIYALHKDYYKCTKIKLLLTYKK